MISGLQRLLLFLVAGLGREAIAVYAHALLVSVCLVLARVMTAMGNKIAISA